MRAIARFLASALLAGGIANPAYSQVGLPAGQGQLYPQVSGGGYTGPCDAVACTAFWSVTRAATAATRGTTAMTVCTASDAICIAVASDATTGIVPVPNPSGVLPCNNSTNVCTVKTINDQIGGVGNVTNATIGTRPTLVIATLGSALQSARFVHNSSQFITAATITSVAQPYSFVTEQSRDAATGFFNISIGNANVGDGWTSTNNQLRLFAGTQQTVSGVTDGVNHDVQYIHSGASSILYVDGTSNTGLSAGTSATGTSLCFGTNNATCNGSSFLQGNIWEVGFYNSGLNSTQSGSINTNMAAFY